MDKFHVRFSIYVFTIKKYTFYSNPKSQNWKMIWLKIKQSIIYILMIMTVANPGIAEILVDTPIIR